MKNDNYDMPFSEKQLEFILNSNCKWNLAHGSVRAGKTVCTVFSFLKACDESPDSKLYIVGHTFDTAFRNVITLILESPELQIYRPFCTWSGKKLHFKDKSITVLGATDEGAIGKFQGDTYSKIYCNEITLYPESIIDMIDTRLSRSYSQGFADMNPSHPRHKVKQWIDKAESGNPQYYSLHFTLDDNPFLGDDYKKRIRESLSGVFFKRNYLGLWCLAEGAIFDFFDRSIYVKKQPPRSAEYWVAGVDVGTVNSFACTLMGVNTGINTQSGVCRWFEKEYVWDSKKKGRQKTNSEYAEDVYEFLEPYGVKGIYVDPSAAAFKLELKKRGLPVIDANNDVLNGIAFMVSEMQKGNLFVCEECPNMIREIQSYVWDAKAAERGEDKPLKRDDHSIDSGRYAVYTHKVQSYQPYKHNPNEYLNNRFSARSHF